MSQNENYHKLARNFLDAWQEQLTKSLSDGETIKIILQMMQAASFSDKENPYAQYTASNTKSAASASDTHDATLARIERGISIIERRLEKLEAAVDSAQPGAIRKVGKGVAKTTRRPTPSASNRKRSQKKGD